MISYEEPVYDPDVHIACIKCHGWGWIERESHLGRRNATSPSWRTEPCLRCEGSGVESCDVCGNPAVVKVLGETLCDFCADDLFDETEGV